MSENPRWDHDPCPLCGCGLHWHSTSLRHDCYGANMKGCECPGYPNYVTVKNG